MPRFKPAPAETDGCGLEAVERCFEFYIQYELFDELTGQARKKIDALE